MAGRVLVVEHEAGAPAAWFGEGLTDAGLVLDVCRPYDGAAVPGVDDYAGVVVLGGSVDAWDQDRAPWLPAVRELVCTGEKIGVPVLGICLGLQLATLALGGQVGRNAVGTTVAVLPIGWLPEAGDDPLLASVAGSPYAVHWNNDVAHRLPPGGQALARSPDGEVQAARLGEHVWGVQYHPEAGPEVVQRWVEEDGLPFRSRGFDLDAYVADARRHRDALAEGCRRLALSFARLVGSGWTT